ncbi:M66 family metalloprotease [Stenotrophobium rhamnosiphilum]|uniref:M66 family metalloprotease n=1 Tax=Stenotrophobium rhamnosiphilum TaxID=2029166 RepID=UPI0013753183|nr:M66 family metalloprotease [Stenotrophobium rhamnosiphilum]
MTKAQLGITTLELAQTHVLPEGGKSWALSNATESLHFVGQRDALALIKLSKSDAINPALEAWANGVKLGAVSLAAPDLLPRTEAAGPSYATDRYSATVPASWMVPGLQLRVSASNYTVSEFRNPLVGADSPMTLRVLPFYLFGATDANSVPFASASAPDATTKNEVFAKWPVAKLTAQNHPAQRANWSTVVIGPRNDSGGVAREAYVAQNSNQQKDGFAVMGSILNVLGGLLNANGEAAGPYQYYAPLIMLNSSGNYAGPGGGLGSVGGDTGVGDYSYSGIFIHEQGHAFGLSHAGEAYDGGRYPYNWGSLNGSAWGFDPFHNEFLAPFVPSTASTYVGCSSDTFGGHARAADSSGRCVKQDPMQSGAGDQASGYKFATFSDFSSAVMQRHLEGTTTVDGAGNHSYSGGSIVADSSFPGGYKRWDSVDLKWVNFTPTTTSGAIWGFDQGMPLQRNVSVYSIVVTYSNACVKGPLQTCPMSQIYPPLSYTGNLMRTIDPTDAAQRASIVPDTSPNYWYCRNGGCDYTVRVTYVGGNVRNVLIQGGFRPFNQPTGAPPASASNATDGNSFRTWVVNVPNEGTIQKIELLSTPMVWNGMPAIPTVLASR